MLSISRGILQKSNLVNKALQERIMWNILYGFNNIMYNIMFNDAYYYNNITYIFYGFCRCDENCYLYF